MAIIASLIVVMIMATAAGAAMAAKPAPPTVGKKCKQSQAGKIATTSAGTKVRCTKNANGYKWKGIASTTSAVTVATAAAPAVTPAPYTPPVYTPPPVIRYAGDALDNPLPFGQSITSSDGWRITLDSFNPNANAVVAAENMFNDPPGAGNVYVMMHVTATNTTSGNLTFNDFSFSWVGATRTDLPNGCRFQVIPNEIPFATTYAGGTTTGNICGEVPAGDVGLVKLVWQGGSKYVYFATQ
ncbi:MAG: hypothetical protein NTX95_10695 [Actinobacteria bacterium]|nr:hypothetical protein [Actinomycetota bacterium]